MFWEGRASFADLKTRQETPSPPSLRRPTSPEEIVIRASGLSQNTLTILSVRGAEGSESQSHQGLVLCLALWEKGMGRVAASRDVGAGGCKIGFSVWV